MSIDCCFKLLALLLLAGLALSRFSILIILIIINSSKFFLHRLGSHHWYSNIKQSYRVFFSISHWGSPISAAGTSGLAGHLDCTLNCFNISAGQVHCFPFLRCEKTSLVVSFCFAGCHDSVMMESHLKISFHSACWCGHKVIHNSQQAL